MGSKKGRGGGGRWGGGGGCGGGAFELPEAVQGLLGMVADVGGSSRDASAAWQEPVAALPEDERERHSYWHAFGQRQVEPTCVVDVPYRCRHDEYDFCYCCCCCCGYHYCYFHSCCCCCHYYYFYCCCCCCCYFYCCSCCCCYLHDGDGYRSCE